MNKEKHYMLRGIIIIAILTLMSSCSSEKEQDFSEIVKISLREVGHQLLLSSQDSTSLVLPVVALGENKYKLSFQNDVSIHPDSLVSIVKTSLSKAELPEHYRVEVKQCVDEEVAYSYGVKNQEEKNIIPCKGRELPQNCYTIELKFTDRSSSFFERHIIMFTAIAIAVLLLIFYSIRFRRSKKIEEINEAHSAIGSFRFYPEQSKLIKEAVEINLSKKECELLEIFVANPNQIIKRDELEKRVWEDQGVYVGRSLDTYISKLRKKLKSDDSIKLTNVHGIGYKLETNL